MGDLEQSELRMIRRDEEIDQYDLWIQELEGSGIDLSMLKFETLLSWICFEEYCSRCGHYESVDKTSADHEFYQFVCGHYTFRWDNTHDWDDEIGAWVPKGGC